MLSFRACTLRRGLFGAGILAAFFPRVLDADTNSFVADRAQCRKYSLAKVHLVLFLQIDKNVERELINHRSLLHPNIIRFKEVHNIIPTTETAVTSGHRYHLMYLLSLPAAAALIAIAKSNFTDLRHVQPPS